MNAALDALRARFRMRCAEDRTRLAELTAAGDGEGVRNLAHKLAGAAGTFGYGALSEAALQLEHQTAYGDAPEPALVGVVDRLLASAAEEAST